MKTTPILKGLLLLVPFNAFAHPGHGALVGFASVELLAVSALLGVAALYAALSRYRRRKSASADD